MQPPLPSPHLTLPNHPLPLHYVNHGHDRDGCMICLQMKKSDLHKLTNKQTNNQLPWLIIGNHLP